MKTMKLGQSDLQVPVMAVGCSRIHTVDFQVAETLIQTALECGINYFDNADGYGRGTGESIFSEAIHMSSSIREKIFIQSKCGNVHMKRYDSSRNHILESVDGSLKRLKTEYLDMLLLHKPDALVEPDEVAEAFDILQASGKVRNFGVSNHNPMRIQLLRKSVRQPIVVNQLQMSITNASMIANGINTNTVGDEAIDRDGFVLDFCRLNDITIQTWSPFQFGHFEGVFLDNDRFPALNAAINEIAARYGVSNTTIALAWILRHPAHMQPIVGTMNAARLRDCAKASEIKLNRDEWYQIYQAAGHSLQ